MWVGSSHLCAKFSERVGKFSCFQIFYTSVTLLDIYLQVFFFCLSILSWFILTKQQYMLDEESSGWKTEDKVPKTGEDCVEGNQHGRDRQQTESRRSREGENTGETLDIWRAPILGRNCEKQRLWIQRNQIWEPSQRLRNRSSSSWTGI